MMNILRISFPLLLFTLLIPGLSSCKHPEGIIIVLGKAASMENSSLIPQGEMKLGLFDPSKPDESIKVVSEDFFSACSPVVSYDGKCLLFSGKKAENDQWQIWEMELGSNDIRQVTSSPEPCLFPAYLPDSRIVYSKMMRDDSLKSELALFRCNNDGSSPERITFSPASWYASTVLLDGRILAKCMDNYPERSPAEYMVLRPDGTKAELFYQRMGILTGGKAHETTDGRIIFTEVKDNKSLVVSTLYTRPFSSTNILSENLEGDFLSVSEGKDGNLVACYRNSPGEKFRLVDINNESGHGNVLYENKEFDILDAAIIREQQRPRKLPSEVDIQVKTGQIMCQDINFRGFLNKTNAAMMHKAARIEIFGTDSSYGTVEVENDGSFYLKVLADKPFRIATLDKNGNSLVESSGWIWLRPNERRGCVGCHEDPEFVPDNRIPEAVKKLPIIIPVNISSIKEKTVDLE